MDDEQNENDALRALISAGTRAVYTPPEPTTDRQFAEVDQSTFDNLLKPAELLAIMPYGLANREQLHRELRNGRYEAVADEIVWAYQGKTGRDRLALIPPSIWSTVKLDAASDFWLTGYFDLTLDDGSAGYAMGLSNWMRSFDTRFSAPGLIAASTSVATPADDPKPTVAKADLKRWHDVFVTVYPDAAEALALRSACAMFPDHNVPRQFVRDLRGPQKRGKPVTRQQ